MMACEPESQRRQYPWYRHQSNRCHPRTVRRTPPGHRRPRLRRRRGPWCVNRSPWTGRPELCVKVRGSRRGAFAHRAFSHFFIRPRSRSEQVKDDLFLELGSQLVLGRCQCFHCIGHVLSPREYSCSFPVHPLAVPVRIPSKSTLRTAQIRESINDVSDKVC